MNRAIIIDEDAANRLTLASLPDDWIGAFNLPPDISGVQRVPHESLIYFVGANATKDSKLLVVGGHGVAFFPELPENARLECFLRILRAALSKFQRGVRIPVEWRQFHSDSLISFQSNRWSSGLSSRVYMDFAPESTEHIYAFAIVSSETIPLTRTGYDANLFVEAVLRYEDIISQRVGFEPPLPTDTQLSFALTQTFADSNITQGIRYSIWRQTKLTTEQRKFFDAEFIGPLRVRGAAGTGKTLVLTMRFLKELYERLDKEPPVPVRAAFIAHGQETADQIRNYLMLIDERDLLTNPPASLDMHITTLHGLAYDFISIDTEGVQPLSLDGTEGRILQFELVQSLVQDYAVKKLDKTILKQTALEFRTGLQGTTVDGKKAFCCDLIDEFANVLEAFGTREVDEIADRYLKVSPSPRGLGQNLQEKQIVLELYREFRAELASMRVVSLDQFISDFQNYLNSFRWQAVRPLRGFDFVFADELQLFNRLERPVLGYLLCEANPARVAVAYDPRQSPRNSFFPESRRDRDNIWSEAKLDFNALQFKLTVVFRYTPQIAAFLQELNLHFPAFDLAEEWELPTFHSQVPNGPTPSAYLFPARDPMGQAVSKLALRLVNLAKKGERVAVLTLDPERFAIYRIAGVFQDGFVSVGGRDEIGVIQKDAKRAVLSMPEYVAGLQFDTVLLMDANATLVGQLGGGLNGLQRFISAVYLGASRAKTNLKVYADESAGGFAQPIRASISAGVIDLKSPPAFQKSSTAKK